MSKIFFIGLIILTAIDIIWLDILGKTLYKTTIGKNMHPKGHIKPFYCLIINIILLLTLLYFLYPQFQSYSQAFWQSTLLGLSIFSIHNFSCAAVFRVWSHTVTCIDTISRSLIFGGSSTILYAIVQYLQLFPSKA
ncbi:MAG: DUF2177 family protein [Planctomycetes bacterium]|jgi:uncharacterized membrane protein|nr:DUF2177 family protein [Planctomycetota bacterium]HNZ66966.1 DUF2177 family protein [Planctomycetota bacterium]HPY74951.1 DUF2177 family protein [Planctomycetota bacterium]HQB00643.1 DUF2177 family protein [Planctomycetota bacterium]HRU51412.1 DUF2177 family protein [Planctomycetota bacterium]